jgi:hypothetical protein
VCTLAATSVHAIAAASLPSESLQHPKKSSTKIHLHALQRPRQGAAKPGVHLRLRKRLEGAASTVAHWRISSWSCSSGTVPCCTIHQRDCPDGAGPILVSIQPASHGRRIRKGGIPLPPPQVAPAPLCLVP